MASGIDRRDRDVAILAGIMVAVFAVCLAIKGVGAFRPNALISNALIYASPLFLYIAARTLKIAIIDRPVALTATIIDQEFNADRRQRFWAALPMLLCLVIFMPVFSAMKSAIPLFNDYSWDGYFTGLDRQIHGGDAWQLLQPLIGYPLVTSILSVFYHSWVLLIYIGGTYFAFRHHDPVLRQRYFLSYFLAWSVIGALFAIIFASVGPCFAGPILGQDDFVPLMQYLQDADQHYPVLVLDVQNLLLKEYQNASHGLGRGITAMPSMHVSLAFLFFLAMRHVSRVAAWLSGIFCVIILIGSVHLAYHYAVDGYASIIVTAVIWKVVGIWSNRRTTVRRSATLSAFVPT